MLSLCRPLRVLMVAAAGSLIAAGMAVPARAQGMAAAPAVRTDVGVLEQSFEPTDSATTRIILKTGLLASNGLMHDARRQVLEALAATPDDPALYTLLGALYERGELRQLATTAYQEAQLLLDTGRPSAPPPR
jgi:Flp pilus assembly protein TadD